MNQSIKAAYQQNPTLFGAMGIGFIEVNAAGAIAFTNPFFCQISGYNESELIGKPVRELFLANEHLHWMGLKEAHESATTIFQEIPVHNKQGELRWWLANSIVYDNQQGFIGLYRDITEHKLLQVEIEVTKQMTADALRMQEAFMANMSHEIRTPLNAITGMIKALSRSELNAEQRTFVSTARVAADHLLSTLNDFLDLSKINAGAYELSTNHFSLQEVINETTQILQENASAKQLYFNVLLSNDLAPVLIGDATAIRQILINVVGNAIKFTDKGGITIQCNVLNTNAYQQEIGISVNDTGIGMDKVYLLNLFKKFVQADNSSGRKHGGTGLGMPITYELIKLMGGNIVATSEIGIGTRVDITLTMPIGNQHKINKVAKEYDYSKLKGLKILLVEDNAMNQNVGINILNHYQMQVTVALNGKEAVELLKQKSFDLILMDLQMPIMGGMEATKIIRNELMINTPIIALTANAMKKDVDQALALGMNDYITKPFDEKRLLLSILHQMGVNSTSLEKENEANTEAEAPNVLYNLSKLHEISHGSNEFVIKMVNYFINETPMLVTSMFSYINNQQWQKLRDIAHTLKPTFDMMGIQTLKAAIQQLESFDEGKTTPTALTDTVLHIEQVVSIVITALRADMLL